MGPCSQRGLKPGGVVVVRLLTTAVRAGAYDVAFVDQSGYVLTTANGVGK